MNCNNKYKYFNGPQLIARYEASALTCNGYIFNTKNDKLREWFYKFEKHNKLKFLLYSIIYNNSLNGRSIIGLEKTGDNVSCVIHYYLSTAEISSDCVGTPRVAKLLIPANFDNKNYKIDRIYTEDKIISKVYNAEDVSEVECAGDTYQLSKDCIIQKEYIHNLGFIPMTIFYNLPYRQTQYNPQNILIRLNGSQDTSYSNTLFKFFFQNDGAYVEELCAKIDKAYDSLFSEMIKSETMMVISGGNKRNIFDENADMIDTDKREAFKKTGFLMNVDDRNVKVDFKNNTNKLNEIYALIESLIEDYFNKCGLSLPKPSGGNNKHTAEIKTLMLQTLETHKTKRECLEMCAMEMIWKAAVMSGFSEEEASDFTFQLVESSLTSELERAQALQIKLQSGLVDRERLIQEENHMSQKEAQELKEKIDQDTYTAQVKSEANKGVSDANKGVNDVE